MAKLEIYCISVKEFAFFNYLPKNIIPLILGKKNLSHKYLSDKTGDNIHKFNKYFGELTGMYWVYKNQLQNFKKDDWIGFCQYRRFFLDDVYDEKHNIKSDLYSKILVQKNSQFNNCDVIMIKPTIFKQNIYDHFVDNHGEKLLNESFKILDNENSKLFKKYLQNNECSICNMFITKPEIFIKYCEFIFPFLNTILNYCLKENLCVGKNIRLPVFFLERFTSYWFLQNFKVNYLSYAVLNNYFTSNILNRFYNTLKTPLSFKNFPTILKV